MEIKIECYKTRVRTLRNISNERRVFPFSLQYIQTRHPCIPLIIITFIFFFVRFILSSRTHVFRQHTYKLYTHTHIVSRNTHHRQPTSNNLFYMNTLCVCVSVYSVGKISETDRKTERKEKSVYMHVVQFTFWLLRKTCDETFHPPQYKCVTLLLMLQLMSRIILFRKSFGIWTIITDKRKRICVHVKQSEWEWERHAHKKPCNNNMMIHYYHLD